MKFSVHENLQNACLRALIFIAQGRVNFVTNISVKYSNVLHPENTEGIMPIISRSPYIGSLPMVQVQFGPNGIYFSPFDRNRI